GGDRSDACVSRDRRPDRARGVHDRARPHQAAAAGRPARSDAGGGRRALSVFDLAVITKNLPFFWAGLRTTFGLTAATVVGGLLLGTPLAVARSSSRAWLRYPALAFIEVVRGVPILMLIFWIYFLLPRLLGTAVPSYVAGLVALV